MYVTILFLTQLYTFFYADDNIGNDRSFLKIITQNMLKYGSVVRILPNAKSNLVKSFKNKIQFVFSGSHSCMK